MILILPVVAILLFLVQTPAFGQRDRILRTAALFGAAIFSVTEILSLVRAITPVPLFLAWLVIAVPLAAAARKKNLALPPFSALQSIPRLWLIPPAFILLATLVIALAAPPNNWDSMTYHMGRVANWMQHGSVAHYPANILRQLVLSPWAEYAILNLQVLAGGSDRWALLVQWSALVLAALSASMIVRHLNYPRRAQYIAALLVLTTPMAILQSTSTQNDLVAAAWLACFVYFIMKPDRDFIFAAITLGLAVNTKGTAALIAPAFAIGAWLVHGKSVGWSKATMRFAGIALIALMINVPFFIRNTKTFDHPSGDPALVGAVKAEAHDPLHLVSNVIRQMSIHWGTPVGRITWGTELAIIRAHGVVGLDASDPKTSYTKFHVIGPSSHEDEAPNPVHFWLITVGVIVLFAVRRSNREARAFALELCIALLLFSALLKWQIWASRLQLPLFVLGAVAAAAGFYELFAARKAHRILAIVMFISCLPWIFLNRTRPLITVAWDPAGPGYRPGTARSILVGWLPAKSVLSADRTSQMFINRKKFRKQYENGLARAESDGCGEIGLITKEDSWEYPLHVLARSASSPVRFRHVGVSNASRTLRDNNAPLCAIIVLDEPPIADHAMTITSAGTRFVKVSEDSAVRVFKPTTSIR